MHRNVTALAAAVLMGTVLAASGQTSVWNRMAVAGHMNGWNKSPNMALIADDTWQVELYVFSAEQSAFKFVANDNWAYDFGETNQDNFFVDPGNQITGVAEPTPGDGADIMMSNMVSGIYRFTFNDQTRDYTVEWVRYVNASYGRMAVAGDLNGWSSSPNLQLAADNVWQADLYVRSAARSAFKFVAEDNWDMDFGETNQTDFHVPLNGTAEYKPGYGNDIVMSNVVAGIYRFVFNDTNYVFSVTLVGTGTANFASMAVAADFNGWNPSHNMELVADNTWEGIFEFVQRYSIMFKFAANDSWSTAWGETDQSLWQSPLYGTAESVSGEGNDIYLYGPLNGRYVFRFNDLTRQFSVIQEGLIQNFDNWIALSYRTETNAGWVIHQALTATDQPRFGRYARLRDTVSSNSYIRTPLMPGGVLGISFWYRSWDTNNPALVYQVQTSTNGTTWVTNHICEDLRTLTYTNFTLELNITNGCYVRLYHTAGANRLLVDDFVVFQPFADTLISDITINPEHPWSNDSVSVSGYVEANALARDMTATLYYRVGTSGTYSAIGMTGDTNYYTTTNSIPAQPPGSRVYYFVQASFDGPGGRSPKFWPSTGSNSPAWYGVTRNRHGSVWINEVNYLPGFFDLNTNQFVEICGPAHSDIGDWSVELLDAYIPYAMYLITNNTLLPNDVNGYGFFVIGDSGTPNARMYFTNVLAGGSHIAERGTISLRNEFGVPEYVYTYGTPPPSNIPGAVYIGADYDLWFDDESLCLHGTGSNYSDMAWGSNSPPTPGVINAGQTLVGGNPAPLPSLMEAEVFGCWRGGTQMVLWVTSTNGWNAAPYYSLNVTSQWPNGWIPISPYFSIYEDGACTVWFDWRTNAPNAFFRLKSEPTW